MTKTTKPQIIGRKPVKEALQRKEPPIEKIFLHQNAGGKEIQLIRQLATESVIPFQFVPESRLARMCPRGNHQGVIALIAPKDFLEMDDMLQQIAPLRDDVESQKPVLLVLDRIEDPHNFGAILRSGLAAGVQGVIVPSKRMAPLNDTVIKTSAGTALQMPIARVKNLVQSLYQLKERGYWVVGADQNASTDIYSYNWNKPLALVVGSESGGIHDAVLEQCDSVVSIPMYGPVESLNVSVATALFVYAVAQAKNEGSQGRE